MARRFYNEQEPDLYEDQFGSFYYDPYTGEFVSIPATSGIGAPEVAYYDPAPAPTYYDPAPVYYPPARESEETYYDPTPVYYEPPPPPPPAPEPVYYPPAPVYYEPPPPPPPPPVYVAPPPPPPAPEPAPAPVYYAPVPESAPTYYEPEPVYVAPPPAPVSGIGSPAAISYEPEQTYTQATVAQSAEPAPVSGIGSPAVTSVAPQPEPTQSNTPEMTPEFLQQLQQGAAIVGNAAQSGGISALFAPGTLSTLDPLYDYAKTAPIYDLAGNASTEQYKFQPLPNTKYRLVVNKDVIGEASTPAEAARLAELYNQYSSSGGNNIYVAFQQETPTADAQGNPTTTYIPFFENQNEKNRDALFQSMMMAAGAIMGGAALGPALGGTAATATAPATAGVLGSGTLAGIAGTGLGAAAGTFAGGIGSGVPLDEALKRAAISGVTAGVLKGVMPGGVGDAAAGKSAAASKLGGFTPVPGAGGMTPIPVDAFSGLAQTPLPVNAFSGLAQSATAPIIVTAAKNAISPVLSGIGGAAAAGGFDQFLSDNAGMVGDGTTAPEPAAAEEPGIVVTSRPYPNVDLTGGLATVPVSTLLNLGINTPTDVSLDDTEIDVEGRRIRPGRVSDVIPAATGALNLGTPPIDISLPGGDGELIDVAGNRIRPTRLPDEITTSLLSEIPGTKPTVYDPNQIVVTGQREVPATKDPVDLLAPVASEFVVSDLVNQQGKSLEQEQAEKDNKKGLTPLQKASAGLTLASALADAVGGGGGGDGGPLDLGAGYTIPGAGSGIGRTRNVATFDPFTYGQKEGEFAFFRNASAPGAATPGVGAFDATKQPSGGLLGALNNPIILQNLQEAMAADPAFNAAASTGMAEGGEVDDDMVSHLIAYRKGGGHMGPGQVKGIGSGQDDKIPAWLSDGEYVWSAQDVADLGDGSTDEGVRRLDKMRQMVRKGAGRKDVKKIAKPQRGIEDMLKAVGGAV